VSKDADFPDLLALRGVSNQLIWVRVGNTLNRVLLQRLDAEWARIESELIAGASIVKLD
jgi:predicted nuclease of predicted toxin-antitoxin system